MKRRIPALKTNDSFIPLGCSATIMEARAKLHVRFREQNELSVPLVKLVGRKCLCCGDSTSNRTKVVLPRTDTAIEVSACESCEPHVVSNGALAAGALSVLFLSGIVVGLWIPSWLIIGLSSLLFLPTSILFAWSFKHRPRRQVCSPLELQTGQGTLTVTGRHQVLKSLASTLSDVSNIVTTVD